MSETIDPVMKGVIPYINVEGAIEALAFYEKAFAAKELARMPAEDGKRLMHGHLEINGGSLMVSDVFPEAGYHHQPSHSFTMQLVVDDAEAWFNRAVAAGCEVTNPVQVMFWGDKWGSVRDPFQVHWAFNEPAKKA
jgi:uncharacterized glyoxalase superfamily protein PhnB